MKTKSKSKAASRKARLSLAKRITAAPDFRKKLDLAVHGAAGRNPEADFIGRWLFIKDCNSNDQSLKALGNGDLDAGRQRYREILREHLRNTGRLFGGRIMAQDSDYFRRFADELDAEKNRPAEFTIEDPVRAALLLRETIKPARTLASIATELGVEPRAVARAARQMGIKPGKPGRPKKPDK